ncbi:MAG: hypothetical protein EOO46_00090 [Flavobacterium sp.]|nr:MAG: hypothetical protein EOO46_00090 [Flavobacterium sp.]
MKLFNFFGSKTINNPTEQNDARATELPTIVDRTLFIEDEAPETTNAKPATVSDLKVFLEKNYEWMGFNDGYAQPDADYMNNRISALRAHFRLAIDKSLDTQRIEVSELKLHLIDVEGISPRLEAKLKEKISQLEINVHELDIQKVLSVEDEGYVAPVIHSYRLGFIRGLGNYQQEKLFAGSTGLFNQ